MATKRTQRKSIKKLPKLPPIVVVPDKSYLDAKGDVIPTDVILIADLEMYRRMNAVLSAWGKEPMGVPGQRGVIEG